jgi:hypothetical protein
VEQDRREFLKTMAGAYAAVAGVPGNALPQPIPADDLINLSLFEAGQLGTVTKGVAC